MADKYGWVKGRYRGAGTSTRFARYGEQLKMELGTEVIAILRQGAETIAELARNNVTNQGTGALKASIKVIEVDGGRKYLISADAINPKNGVAYGQYVEFNPNFSKEGPKPFLYPAFRGEKKKLKGKMKRAIQKSLDTAKKGAGQ